MQQIRGKQWNVQYFLLILYILVSSVFAYIRTSYIEAVYYRVENSVMYSIFLPVSVIVPLGLLFGKYIFDCKLNGNKTLHLVLNILLLIICGLGYIFWGLHHPEVIYYILFLAAEELMVVIFILIKKE